MAMGLLPTLIEGRAPLVATTTGVTASRGSGLQCLAKEQGGIVAVTG
jgi:hypothetical protein